MLLVGKTGHSNTADEMTNQSLWVSILQHVQMDEAADEVAVSAWFPVDISIHCLWVRPCQIGGRGDRADAVKVCHYHFPASQYGERGDRKGMIWFEPFKYGGRDDRSVLVGKTGHSNTADEMTDYSLWVSVLQTLQMESTADEETVSAW